jgi:hypothetical protein
MSDRSSLRRKPLRVIALVTGIAFAGLLSGCVVYPAGPGYYHHYHYRGWH